MPAPVTRTDEILVELLEEVRGLRADLAKPQAGEVSAERVAGEEASGSTRTRRRTRTEAGKSARGPLTI